VHDSTPSAVLDAFLAFLEGDMQDHPGRLEPLSAGSISRAVELTEGIAVGDDEIFPDEVTL
jgi:antitoxin PrlF